MKLKTSTTIVTAILLLIHLLPTSTLYGNLISWDEMRKLLFSDVKLKKIVVHRTGLLGT